MLVVLSGLVGAGRARAASRRRVAVVTGANSGIGLAAATALAALGWEIVPACRSAKRARESAEDISEAVPDASVRQLGVACDLSDLRSVGDFGAALRKLGAPVDVLLLNAGIDGAPYQRTAQGHELHFGVNHLGHFGLWVATQDLLRASGRGSEGAGPGRVVSVTSSASVDAEIAMDDLDWERRGYSRHVAYASSKACNVLFAEELARREAAGDRLVVANAVDPGPSATGIVRYAMPDRAAQRREMSPKQLKRQACQLNLNTPSEAAEGLVWLAAAQEAGQKSGGWWIGPALPVPAAVELPWRTTGAAAELWRRSEALVAPYV